MPGLRGYAHQRTTTQEAFDRAYEADAAGKVEVAAKLYRTGLEAVHEGLALSVENSGLGPTADSVASWKDDLTRWQRPVLDRCVRAQEGTVGGGEGGELWEGGRGQGARGG